MIQRRKRTSTPAATPSQRRSNALQVALSQDFSERDQKIVESLGNEIIDTIGSDKSSQVFEEIGNFIVTVQTNEDLSRHCCEKVPLGDLKTYNILQTFIYEEILGGVSNVPRRTQAIINQQIISILNIVCKQRFPREDCELWMKSRSRREEMSLELKRLETSKEELQLRRDELSLDRNGWQGELKRRILTLFVVLICIVAFGYFVDAKTLSVISSEIEKFSSAAVKCDENATGSFLCKSVYGYSLWDTLVTPTIYATAGIASKITTITDAVFKTLLAFVFLVISLVVMILPQEASAFGVFSYSLASAPSKTPRLRVRKSPSPKRKASPPSSPRRLKSPPRRLTSPTRKTDRDRL